MEHVIVKYPEAREVMIDGEPTGTTNTILRVEQGTHTFSLAGASDYKPASRTVLAHNTSPVKPMEVTFEKA